MSDVISQLEKASEAIKERLTVGESQETICDAAIREIERLQSQLEVAKYILKLYRVGYNWCGFEDSELDKASEAHAHSSFQPPEKLKKDREPNKLDIIFEESLRLFLQEI